MKKIMIYFYPNLAISFYFYKYLMFFCRIFCTSYFKSTSSEDKTNIMHVKNTHSMKNVLQNREKQVYALATWPKCCIIFPHTVATPEYFVWGVVKVIGCSIVDCIYFHKNPPRKLLCKWRRMHFSQNQFFTFKSLCRWAPQLNFYFFQFN